MNINKIIQAREIISKEIDDNLKIELGTNQFSKLCMIKGDLDVLIKILEDPDKNNKLIKTFEEKC